MLINLRKVKPFFLAFPANPCPPETPFLCRSPQKSCIALGNICDRHPDCPDGFDEDPQMCNASKSLFCLFLFDMYTLTNENRWFFPGQPKINRGFAFVFITYNEKCVSLHLFLSLILLGRKLICIYVLPNPLDSFNMQKKKLEVVFFSYKRK